MITIRIAGGLGNQMFQYAVARGLALKHNTTLQLDLSLFKESVGYIHRYELDQLTVSDYSTPSGLAAARLYILRHGTKRLAGAGMSLGAVYWEKEGDPSFDPDVLALPDGFFLNGYFQSEHYFTQIASTIREEFQPRDSNVLQRVRNALTDVRRAGRPLVSVHVRRSNYLTVRADGSLVVPLQKTLDKMARFDRADFLVFSDDMQWCRQNITGENVRYSPFTSGIEDMAAMAHCDHHIIANSSFSWWGAWLNPNPEKIVIAPANWNHPGSDGDGGHRDLCPPGWIKL